MRNGIVCVAVRVSFTEGVSSRFHPKTRFKRAHSHTSQDSSNVGPLVDVGPGAYVDQLANGIELPFGFPSQAKEAGTLNLAIDQRTRRYTQPNPTAW